jgi:hypothetical protein
MKRHRTGSPLLGAALTAAFSFAASLAAPTTGYAQERPDHRCGPSFSDARCGPTRCCSAGGWCGGPTEAHCSSQVGFEGRFNGPPVAPAPAPAPAPTLTIAGAWSWFNNTVSTFNADGTGRATNNFTCRWRVLDAAARRIEINWNNGQWVDTLTLSADGRSLAGTNQRNMRVTGTRR